MLLVEPGPPVDAAAAGRLVQQALLVTQTTGPRKAEGCRALVWAGASAQPAMLIARRVCILCSLNPGIVRMSRRLQCSHTVPRQPSPNIG